VKILVAESVAPEGLELLRAQHDVDERIGLTKDDYRALLPEYDALVVRSQVQVDADLIDAGRRLVVIGRAGVGVDNVDLDAATRAGITVVNAPTGNTIAAAEHTLALLYVLARRVAAADASVRRGEWKRSQFTGVELRGRTLGIIGLGKIGQAIAKRARAMEMTVIAVDPYISTDSAAVHGVELVTFDALLERADAITVHVPLTRQTRGLIGAPEIARMKAGAFLLNVARGGILDEAAVADALHSGHLGGAGIDVFDHEPPVGSPLLAAPNTVLTPHLGASTAEAQVLVAEEVAAQIIDVLAGRPARYAVNAPLLTPETARVIAPYLPLAEILGRFFAQFSRTGVQRLTLEVGGELARELAGQDATPLTAAVLRGLLETSTTERVNLVNATSLARARGIAIVERKSSDAGAYSSLLTLTGEADGTTTTIGGTVANGEARLTRLNDHSTDLAPSPVMLVTRHQDRPGTVGRIGSMLGAADVNISAMHLARSVPRADALMILALDDDVPPAVADAIRAQEAVLDLWLIRLGTEH
jgi:D-3-phosphoglycerate dehydrogenase